MDIFYEIELGEYLNSKSAAAAEYINKQDATYLLNVAEDEFVQHVIDKFPTPALDIDFDSAYITTSERNIQASKHPFSFDRGGNWSHPRQVVTYHLPFHGDATLLRCVPNPRVMNTVEVRVSSKPQEIQFDVIDFSNDAGRLKSEIESEVGTIRTQYGHVSSNLNSWAEAMPSRIQHTVTARRAELSKRAGAIAALGIPVKAKSDYPDTFAVPVTRKPVFAPDPKTATKKPEVHPTLSGSVYEQILRVIFDTGRSMERLPSVYRGKQEEDLRDFLIMQLEPRFEGETTGETFNKGGKTDILVRHHKENVFVAECKFWHGQKQYLDAIGQLQNYLTWRDSKTAILLFVKGKSVQLVLDQLVTVTQSHPSHVETLSPTQEGWSRFKFALKEDPHRTFELAVLVFHFADDE